MKNENLLNETNKVSIRIAYAYDSKAPAHWSQGVVGRYDVYSEHYGSPQEIYRCDKVSADQALLNEIWAGWNNGSGEECDAFRGANARSMMIGDYVEITFRDRIDYYRVESTGWSRVSWRDLWAEVDAYEASHQFAELQAHQLESDGVEQESLKQAESAREFWSCLDEEPEDRY